MLRFVDRGKSSMFFWWDRVKDLGIPVPKTEMVRWDLSMDDLVKIIDRKEFSPNIILCFDELYKAMDCIGYPLFLRTDESSNKHHWNRTCYVESKKCVPSHVAELIEFCLMVEIGFDGFAVREFLDLDWKFKSHDGMPVAAERRYFVDHGKVTCWHPYWPPASIKHPTVDGWRSILDGLQTPGVGEVELLTGYAEKIGETLGGEWSIDFCRHENGTWYLTDMARGPLSYHWATCPNADPSMMVEYGDPDEVKDEEEDDDMFSSLLDGDS